MATLLSTFHSSEGAWHELGGISHLSKPLSVWALHHLHLHTKQKSQKRVFFSLCSCRVKDYWVVFLALRKICGGLSCRTCSCLKTLKPLLLKQWSPKEHREPLWCTLEAAWCFQFNTCCSGGILVLSLVAQKAEPLLLQTFPRGGSRRCQWRWARGWAVLGMVWGREGMDGWAVEWDLQLQWLYALPGSTCTWGTSAKFTAAVQRSWAAQAGSVGESGNGGVLWNS